MDSRKRSASAAGFADNSRFTAAFKPRKVCTFFLQGRCQKGPNCTFAHSEEELAPDARFEQQQAFAEMSAAELDAEAAAAEAEAAEALRANADLESFAAIDGVPLDRQSLLQGPREFRARPPDKLCQMWLRHPVMCIQGDSCPLSHGLLEMGIENTEGVAVETRTDGLTADVQILGMAPSAGPSAPGAYFSSGRASPSAALAKGGNGCKGAPAGGMGKGCYKGKGAEFWGKGLMAAPAQAALPMHPAAYELGEPLAAQDMGMPHNRFAGSGGFMPNKICSFWVQSPSMCAKGDQCTFAHGVGELLPSAAATCGVSRFLHTGFTPSKYCQFFAEGRCSKGLACTFAHSSEEMIRGPQR